MQTLSYLSIFILSAFILEGYSAATDNCPPKRPFVRCLVDPCSQATCEGDPTATCYGDYCGGCYARWVTMKDTPAPCNRKKSCPPTQPEVLCFADPCSVETCPGDPTAICFADYCGGCNTYWLTTKGTPAQCKAKECPRGQIVQCLIDPCRGKTCPANPDAECVANYCGGCSYTWVGAYGQTVQCDSSS